MVAATREVGAGQGFRMRDGALDGQAGIGGLERDVHRHRRGGRGLAVSNAPGAPMVAASVTGVSAMLTCALIRTGWSCFGASMSTETMRSPADIGAQVGGAEMQGRRLDMRHRPAAVGELRGEVHVVQRRQPGARATEARWPSGRGCCRSVSSV